MLMENQGKNSVYTVYSGELEDLAEEITRYCHGQYGERCEFYTVSIERATPEGDSWKVHEYPAFDDETAEAIRRHLQTRRDFVRIVFGGDETDYELEFIVSPARNTSCLARYVKGSDLEKFDSDDLVVLTVEKKRDEIDEEQRDFLESISK
ncbi:MAG: hypothetical protein ABEJ75_03845 [Candidatus Nanohaloarchaea archaeon]